MDLFEELESMAINAADNSDADTEPSERELTRRQPLFGYPYPEAVEQAEDQKSNFVRCRASNGHWDLVRSRKEAEGFTQEAEGFTREAYEH